MASTAEEIKKRKKVLQKQPVTDKQVQQIQGGQQFISAREKAKSQGATQEEANAIANQQTAGVSNIPLTLEQAQAAKRIRDELAAQTGQPTQTPTNPNQQVFRAPNQSEADKALTDQQYLDKYGNAFNPTNNPANTPVAQGVLSELGSIYKTNVFGLKVSGFTDRLQAQQEANVAVSYRKLPDSIKGMNQDISLINKGGDVAVLWQDFQNQLEAIDQAEAELKQQGDSSLNVFLKIDTTKQLGYIKAFNEQLRQKYIDRMNMALQNPNPNAPTDLTDYSFLDNTQQ